MAGQNQGFPQINAPMVDTKSGLVTPAWFKLFLSLWQRTGAGQGESSPYVPSNVAITGGSINGTAIGDTDPANAVFNTVRVLVNFSASNFSGSSHGVNTGDVTLSPSSQNYISLTNQQLLANPVNLSGANATGILAAARFPALAGDITTTTGSVATTLATVNASPGTYKNATVTVNAKGLVTLAVSPGVPVANGTYTVGARLTPAGTDGTITTAGGIITAITQAT